MGVFLLLGAFITVLRMKLAYAGFAAATLALILRGRLAVGLPEPSELQVSSLVLAIVQEIALFATLMPSMRRFG
jgi:hypothetical protein